MPSNGVYLRLPPVARAWMDGLKETAGVSRSDVVTDALNLLITTVLASPNSLGLGITYARKYTGFIPGKEKRDE